MRLLPDTHLLLWAAISPERLPDRVRSLIASPAAEPFFSGASIWEVTIRKSLGRSDGIPDPQVLRRALMEHDDTELAITSAHATAVTNLPGIHGDPFDRILIAQAQVEGMLLLTADRTVARYPGPIQRVRVRRRLRATETPRP